MSTAGPQQLFTIFLGLVSAGIVAATFVSSGVLEHERDAAPPSTPPAVVQEPVDAPPVPPVEGSGASAEAMAVPDEAPPVVVVDETDPTDDEAVAAAPDTEWAPLRRAEDGDDCLVRANRAMIATGLHRREPVGTEGPFTANGEPLVVFMDFANGTGVSHVVSVIWEHDNGTTHFDETQAGAGSRWRTWVERPLPLEELGHWTVSLIDSERCLIASVEFDLEAPSW